MALMEDGQSAEKPPAVCNCTEKCEAGAVNTKCEVCSTDMTGCTGKEPEPPKEPTEPEKKEPAGLNPAVLLLVLAVMGGAAFAYFKFIKGKANHKNNSKGIAISCDAAQVINDKKVTDHHAVIPTRNLQNADLSGLPVGEKAVLELVAQRLLCAVAEPHTYSETAVTVECAGAEFTAKGKTVKHPGWRALDTAYRAALKNAEPDKENEDKALPDGDRLPELSEGQTLPLSGAAVKEGKTYDATVVLEDDGRYANFKLEFDRQKGGAK